MDCLQEASAVRKESDYIIQTRRHLHRHPELSLHEYDTASYIRSQLDGMGIPYEKVGETGTLGRIVGKEKTGKTVLFRADIDALPIQEKNSSEYQSQNKDVMHACGHDAHTAALLGAAKVLNSLKGIFHGTILLAFQQAEEFGHGSHFFAERGLIRHIDRAFGIHISPDFPCGKIAVSRGTDAASCDYFKITVTGRSAHISKPHLGIDALAAAAEIVLQLQRLKAEALDPLDRAVIGVGSLRAGTAYNIVAQKAVIEGTVRALSYETQKMLTGKIQMTAQATAGLYGAEADVFFETFASPLINDDTAFEEICEVASGLLGKDNVITDHNLIFGFGADDFAEFIKENKGVYIHVGVANDTDPHTRVPLHNENLDIDEKALIIAAELHVAYALYVLRDEKKRKRGKSNE